VYTPTLPLTLAVGVKHGSLSFATSKRRFDYSTGHRLCYGTRPPPNRILHNRYPSIVARSYALNSSYSPSALTFLQVKAGYPPRALTAVIPELPLSSLGLAPGDQLIVIQKSGSAASPGVTPRAPTLPSRPHPTALNPPTSPPPSSSNARQVAAASSAPQRDGPDYVEAEGGYLIHWVRITVVK
jgi:hypothetical protein